MGPPVRLIRVWLPRILAIVTFGLGTQAVVVSDASATTIRFSGTIEITEGAGVFEPTPDLDLQHRIRDGDFALDPTSTVDMGAFEFLCLGDASGDANTQKRQAALAETLGGIAARLL